MICKHLQGTQCLVATQLCGFDAETKIETCEACSKQDRPQQENLYTLGLAGVAIAKNGRNLSDFPDILEKIKRNLPSAKGPGTELKKLIAWFYSPDKKKCKCATRIAKMNRWGPDECEKRIDTILRWLKHSARINKVPFFEPAVKLLIRKAIKNSRLQ